MSIKLDLSKFKHVKSDANTTTLAHEKDGHTITLSHKSLSKPNQEQLQALAKMSKPNETPVQGQESTTDQRTRNADITRKDRPDTGYGKVIYKADGGDVPDVDKEQPADTSVPAAAPAKRQGGGVASLLPLLALLAKGGKVPQYAEGSQDGTIPEYLRPNSPETAAQQQPQMPAININVGGQPAQQVQPNQLNAQDKSALSTLTKDDSDSMDQVPELNKSGPSPDQSVVSQPQANPVTSSLPGWAGPAMNNSPVIDSRSQPQEGSQSVPSAPMDAMSPEAGTANAPQTQPKAVMALKPVVQAPRAPEELPPDDKFKHDMIAWSHDLANQHIEPKTYNSMFTNKSTPGKIATIFGMLLSGAGSGLSKQPNMLLEMMDKEISRDLDAQKTSKSNALNFLNLARQQYMDQFGIKHMQIQDMPIVDQIGQNLAARASYQKLSDTANAITDPVQKQKAIQALHYVSQGLDSKMQDTASMVKNRFEFMKNMSNSGGNDPASDLRQKQMGGVINEGQYKEGLKEVGQIENHVHNNNNALDSFDKVAKMATLGSSLSSPIQNSKRIEAEWAPMMDKLTKDTEGRVTPITVEMMSSLKPAISDDKKTLGIKREKLNAILNAGLATPTLDSLGMHINKGQQSAPETKTLNGVNYQKVDGGWKKLK